MFLGFNDSLACFQYLEENKTGKLFFKENMNIRQNQSPFRDIWYLHFKYLGPVNF